MKIKEKMISNAFKLCLNLKGRPEKNLKIKVEYY